MIKLCRDNHLIWPMGIGGSPNSCPINPTEAHNIFYGGPKLGVLGGGQKTYVEKVYVLFPSLKACRPPGEGGILSIVPWNLRPVIFGVERPFPGNEAHQLFLGP